MYNELLTAIGLEALYAAHGPELWRAGYMGGREGFGKCRFLHALSPRAILAAMAEDWYGVQVVRVQMPKRGPTPAVTRTHYN